MVSHPQGVLSVSESKKPAFSNEAGFLRFWGHVALHGYHASAADEL
jgi:hypothetical protein